MMTRSGFMEVLSQASPYFMNSNGVLGDKRGGGFWTQQENKIFEKALAEIDIKNPESWVRVAALIPGKTVRDVICHYRDLEDDVNHIEAGLVPFPGYNPSTFTLDWGNGFYDGGMKQPPYSSYGVGAKRPGSGGRLSVQDRKKGVPWTEEEHKLFLMGLKKYGKGDWRNISRNFVVTRTPTQVASHAQKYFIRLSSGGKDKRRASIHDITTVNLPDNSPSSPSTQSSPSIALNGAATGFSPSKNGNQFMHLPYGVKLEAQNSHMHM